MKISPKVLNNRLLKHLPRIKYTSDAYKNAVEFRLKQKSIQKPVDLKAKITKVTLYLPYTFEKYNLIHNSLEKVFSKIATLSSFKYLKENEKSMDGRGWYNLGTIFQKGATNGWLRHNSLIIDKLPDHTSCIFCKIYKILPSTSVLSFEFYLDDTFNKVLYEDFYSADDVTVKADILFKQLNISSTTSSEKYDKLLNEKIKYLENWILDFFKIDINSVLSVNSVTKTSLKNLSTTKSERAIIDRNLAFFSIQSFSPSALNCFRNNQGYFLLDKMNDIRIFVFEEDEEDLELDKYEDLTTSILLLMIIHTYKNKLEDIRKNSLNSKSLENNELRDITLLCNRTEFQISRLFHEIDLHKLDVFLSHVVKGHDLRTTSFYQTEYSEFFSEQIAFALNQLPKTSLSIKSFLDKEFESVTTEVNSSLQKEMKYLTRVTILIAMLSVAITCLNTDWNEVEKKAESFRTLLVGAKTNK